MQIRNDSPGLLIWRSKNSINNSNEKTISRLSSGMRVNKAADDAAGLTISEGMRAQIRGLQQASKNIQDGISMIQTTEGGLNEVHSLLQRGRELSVQAANDTNTTTDKENIQKEIDQIKKEVDRISSTTEFNTIKVLGYDKTAVTSTVQAPADHNQELLIQYLKSGWLENSENLISNYYGLSGDGVDLTVNLVTPGSAGGTLAWIAYSVPGAGPGKATNLSLNIDMADFSPPTWPNGGTSPMYDDRIIAHELVHAIMGRTMDFAELNTWFKEGTAELIHGADERLKNDIANNGGGTVGMDAIINTLDAVTPSNWAQDSAHYSGAYVAVRYMHKLLKDNGIASGIKSVMNYLNTNQTAKLGDALNNLLPGVFGVAATAEGDFLTKLKADYSADKINFLTNKCSVNLDALGAAEVDTGAIGGNDADGGAARTAESVVSDTVHYTETPLAGFNIIWPNLTTAPTQVTTYTYIPRKIQVGANENQSIDVEFETVDSKAVGINTVDVTTDANAAVTSFENAIEYVSDKRAYYGAIQNKLEHTLYSANSYEENLTSAESRIRDADIAKEYMSFVKDNILSQSTDAMFSQFNQNRRQILSLLAG